MKWVMMSMALWGDGAYTFSPTPTQFDTEEACLAAINHKPGFTHQGQPTRYEGFVCVPHNVPFKFGMRMR